MNTSRHLAYIDWLKIFAIILVVMRHLSWFNDHVTSSLFSICIPIFFVINGGLSLQRDYSFTTILHRNLHLLFIVAFWGCLSSVIWMSARSEPISVKQIISHVCSLDAPYCNHLWFVCSLIVLNFLQPFLREFIKSHNTKEIVILWAIIGVISFQGLDRFLRPISIMENWNGYSLFYYIGGYLLLSNRINTKNLPTWSVSLLAILGFLILLTHNWLLTSNEWWYNHFLHNDLHFDSFRTYPCALLTLAIFELASRIPLGETSVITYIARYTFAIYLIHWTLLLPTNLYIHTAWCKPIILIPVSLLIGILLDKIPYIRKIIQNR